MRDMPSRYDYEVPGAAAFDYLLKRPDVDRERVAIMGYSFGGYYSARIAAFEKRYAACIALSALHWDLAGWQQKIKDANKDKPGSVAQSNFQWRWVAGADDEDGGIEIAKKFSLKDVAKNITCPFLVTHGGNDRVVPVENAPKLYDAVGSKNKTHQDFHHRRRRRRARARRQSPGRHRLRRRLAGGRTLRRALGPLSPEARSLPPPGGGSGWGSTVIDPLCNHNSGSPQPLPLQGEGRTARLDATGRITRKSLKQQIERGYRERAHVGDAVGAAGLQRDGAFARAHDRDRSYGRRHRRSGCRLSGPDAPLSASAQVASKRRRAVCASSSA